MKCHPRIQRDYCGRGGGHRTIHRRSAMVEARLAMTYNRRTRSRIRRVNPRCLRNAALISGCGQAGQPGTARGSKPPKKVSQCLAYLPSRRIVVVERVPATSLMSAQISTCRMETLFRKPVPLTNASETSPVCRRKPRAVYQNRRVALSVNLHPENRPPPKFRHFHRCQPHHPWKGRPQPAPQRTTISVCRN